MLEPQISLPTQQQYSFGTKRFVENNSHETACSSGGEETLGTTKGNNVGNLGYIYISYKVPKVITMEMNTSIGQRVTAAIYDWPISDNSSQFKGYPFSVVFSFHLFLAHNPLHCDFEDDIFPVTKYPLRSEGIFLLQVLWVAPPAGEIVNKPLQTPQKR